MCFSFLRAVAGEDGVSVRVPAKSADCWMIQFVPSVGGWSGCSCAAPRNMAASDHLEYASIIYYIYILSEKGLCFVFFGQRKSIIIDHRLDDDDD